MRATRRSLLGGALAAAGMGVLPAAVPRTSYDARLLPPVVRAHQAKLARLIGDVA